MQQNQTFFPSKQALHGELKSLFLLAHPEGWPSREVSEGNNAVCRCEWCHVFLSSGFQQHPVMPFWQDPVMCEVILAIEKCLLLPLFLTQLVRWWRNFSDRQKVFKMFKAQTCLFLIFSICSFYKLNWPKTDHRTCLDKSVKSKTSYFDYKLIMPDWPAWQ